MVALGVFCIILAFVCICSSGVPGTDYVPYMIGALVWAAIGSVLIAKGRAKQKQQQAQAQQQTVIINNYITQPPEAPKDDVHQSEVQ